MPSPSRRWIVPVAALLLGAGPCAPRAIEIHLPFAPTQALPVTIHLPPTTDLATVTVKLDETDVTAGFASLGDGMLDGTVPLPSPGTHRLSVTREYAVVPGLPFPITTGTRFEVPAPAPALVSIEPSARSVAPRTKWLRMRFASAVSQDALAGFGFAIACNGAEVARSAHALADGTVVLNPTPDLPAAASCRVVWRGADDHVADSSFSTAADAAGDAATVLYDRQDPLEIAPFPDDYWVVDDPARPSGHAIEMPVPPFPEAFQAQAFTALVGQTLAPDGWSRTQPIVLAFSHSLDPSAVPADEVASMQPSAAVQIVDVDPGSPEFGARIPYRMMRRTDLAPDGTPDHVALLFPTLDLREHGHYAVIVTKQAFAEGEIQRPFGASAYFAEVLSAPQSGDAVEVVRAREHIAPVLDTLAALADVPIPIEDVALAISLSIRTQPDVTDLTYIKEQTLAAAPPTLVLPSLSDPCPNANNFCIRTRTTRALEIRGRVRLPDYRDPSLLTFARDEATGLPVQTRVNEVPFMMSLPFQALDGPVPIVMYQHGNPGSPIEVLSDGGNGYHDDAGFAVAGIQDTLNREIGQNVATQVQVILFFAVQVGQLPDYWNQTGADMIGFLRAIQGMGSLDLMHRGPDGLPALGPDGVPEIDTGRILYHGISEGGNNAERFLPFAPEIIAATPTVGGARLGETMIHQLSDSILAQVATTMPELRPVDLWAGLSLFQLGFDPQDGHTYLRHLYRQPLLPFAGSSDVTPPSTLWTEGIGDTLVPNNASRAMAAELGIPQVGPPARVVPTLQQVDAPLVGNLGPGLTSGYFQYNPATTPYCITAPQPEGHYCPQRAPEAQAQRLHFLESALGGTAEIVAPNLGP